VIAERPSVAFWISVSGPDDKENFRYLLETNLRIEGRSKSQVTELIAEWQRGYEALQKGVSYPEFLKLTQTIRQDPFYCAISDELTEGVYLHEQARFVSGEYTVDEETRLMVYVPGFRELLSNINCPVLAIFGEKDTNIDWRKSLALYQDAIGSRPGGNLTIKTFPDGNHGIFKCETGGVWESAREHCDGYFGTMTQWVMENGFGI
jgi:pimeloyl-ACP methyl ester carboxylesterase